MVEERNENLQDADGKKEQKKALQNNFNSEEHEQDNIEIKNESEEKIIEEEKELTEKVEQETNGEKTVDQVVDEIEENVATNSEKHEDESDGHIPLISYQTFDLNELIAEAKKLIGENPIQKIKKHLEEIKNSFETKIHQLREKLESDNEEELKELRDKEREFHDIYKEYKNKLREYYSKIQEQLESNLERRKEIIEELKRIIDSTEYTFEQRLKKFKEIQKSWRTSGAVPRNEYKNIWNTFKHHEERFYDLLDLDRDYRDKVFQENLEEKQKLISKAKELLTEQDIHYIFLELQKLHKQWKEETGPVSREHRENIWEEFKTITKQIHDKRREFYKNLKAQFGDNLIKKQEIIEKLNEIGENLPDTHKNWQEIIKKVEKLRDDFYQIGFVPKKDREEIWDNFKNRLKSINKQKNNFYKNLKELQKDNLDKKLALIKIAQEWKESEDWENATAKFKQIQEEWKQIGHVPRKVSDKIWQEFRTICNYYFDRFHAHNRKALDEEFENFSKKKKFLQQIKEKFKNLPDENNFTIEDIKEIQKQWREIGFVPNYKKYINVKFNKFINNLYDKLQIDKRELSFIKFKNIIDGFVKDENYYKIDQEKRYVRQKIEAIEKEIQQLENNILFIKSSNSNNLITKEVDKKIKKSKEILDFWKRKLDYLNKLEY